MKGQENTRDIVSDTFAALEHHYGQSVAANFMFMFNRHRGPSAPEVRTLPPAQQITVMNAFWRDLLMAIPNTTEVRSWLCEGGDIGAYITTFKDNWMRDIDRLNLLA